MTAMAVAIERKEWALVSLYLLLGVTAAAEKLPVESLSALLEILEGRAEASEKKSGR